MNSRRRHRTAPLFTALLTGVGLAAAACGGGAAAPPVNAPPASPHTAAEKAATLNWLAKTNQMWTKNDFAALDQVTTGEMRTIYQSEEQQETSEGASRKPLQLTGLSITTPCQSSGSPVFVAYGDTDVVTLGQGLQPVAMVFEQVGGAWKLASHRPASERQFTLASAVQARNRNDRTCRSRARQGTRRPGPGAEPRRDRSTWDRRDGGAVCGQLVLLRPGLVHRPVRHADQAGPGWRDSADRAILPDRRPATRPAASRRTRILADRRPHPDRHLQFPAGTRKDTFPDGASIATTRPAVVHHATDTYITTYTATDPPRSRGATVVLDGFFGWPLTANAS